MTTIKFDIDLDKQSIITKDEWSLFYDLAHHTIEQYEGRCYCDHCVENKCLRCRANEWVNRQRTRLPSAE